MGQERWSQMKSSERNISPAMAPQSQGLSGSPPLSSMSPKKTTFQSLGSIPSGMFSPSLTKRRLSEAKQGSHPMNSPTHSIMSSPRLWQKASISRLAEEFFWIGGSVVAQPKWRLGQMVERCMCTMQTGTQMTKLKGKKKGLVRFFYLDEHKTCIRWRPSKKHDKAKISIDSIHEVCEGKKSEIFRRYAENRFNPNCCFSIYYGDRVKSLDLVSDIAEDAHTWITGLKYLMAGISDEDSLARRQRTRDQWLQQTFSEADKNGDGTLSIGEVHQLLHKLNVNLPKQKVRDMFQDGNSVVSITAPKKKRRFGRSIMRSFKRKRKRKVQVKNKALSDGESDYSSSRERTQIVYHPKKRKTMRLSRALSDLVKYTKSVRVHEIETQAFASSWQVSSLNETVMNQILQLKPGELVLLNQRQLLRVYPSNFRVDSSNFNPQMYWNAGCHMVAMNYQTEGPMLELYRAKFASNGNCGYILRPKCMCKGAFNPVQEVPLSGHRKTQLVLKIISGQQLPKPKDSMFGDRGEIIDPFVEVEIIGLPVDCSKQQTRVVDDNGFNPMWEETLVFNIQMPQIALVRFQVWDHDPIGRDFIGQRTVAFTSMMPGYRHVYLDGMTEASIFVHVAINDLPGKMKPANAMQAARKHIQKAAQKHMKSNQRHPSLEVSVQSSEDGRPLFFHKDLDTVSQDSRTGEMSSMAQGPAIRAAIHKGAMSEPVRRAHRVKIHEPPETRRGFFSRMSSTDSNHGGTAPCVKEENFDPDTPFQLSHPENPASDGQNPTEQKEENEPSNCTEMQMGKGFKLEQLEIPEEAEPDEDVFSESGQTPEAQSRTDSVPQSQLVQPSEAKLSTLIPPSSPARVRRTLEVPPHILPSTPIRTKALVRCVPRKQTASPQTPAVNRKPAFHWQTQQEQTYSKQVRRIPNGLCLSDSTSSSNDGSTDSLEFVPACVPAGPEQREGTLQREMKALFDQKMREIHCKSPLFLDGESYLQENLLATPNTKALQKKKEMTTELK
ncbi:1-phosphatidylinositol 4,5-bisphosphate phosphodiesterase eta-2 [Nematolebias whitei]|uniref:1-phosphatidylinositol 4,5-bisphosphate phosphodiesterase eta-2 n=1 Tax=Nematolebias whitei TaxID=451745 RepID=UPI001896DAD3|nr:1-phosphatidylinositol 4,5-bisphosphate phosphodiesterase eta-2 [Nematolebias whitei]